MTRTPLSKKTRFEIFKRDGFTCLFCGRTPPSVTLEVDHFAPVSAGGSNDQSNLVTACFDCNRGKSNRPITTALPSFADQASLMKEREEQLREFQAINKKRRSRLDSEVESVNATLERYAGLSLGDQGKLSARRFVEALGVDEVIEAAELAAAKRGGNSESVFRYFCGICWRKIERLPLGVQA